jgi:flagellar basal body-associated protein FliL
MKKKLMIVVPVLLIALGGVYKFVLAAPKAAEAKPKVAGEVYVLAKQFLVNLDANKFGQLTVGLVLKEGAATAPASKEAPKPPEGFGAMPQEAVVRNVITDELTGLPADELVKEPQRAKLKLRITKALKQHTDVPVEEVLFTDVTVQ